MKSRSFFRDMLKSMAVSVSAISIVIAGIVFYTRVTNNKPVEYTLAQAQTTPALFFEDISEWPVSNSLKDSSTSILHFIEMMPESKANPSDELPITSLFMDINGDSLPDYIYGEPSRRYIILKNKGDSTFERVFKCQAIGALDGTATFKGDCAGAGSPFVSQFMGFNGNANPPINYYYGWPGYHIPLFFNEYQNWNSSVNQAQPNYWTTILYYVASTSGLVGTPFSNYDVVSKLTDINGDGLVDVLYSSTQSNLNLDDSQPANKSIGLTAVIINKGDFTMEVEYKCVEGTYITNSNIYGDCAAQ